jgi:hypothetical protein
MARIARTSQQQNEDIERRPLTQDVEPLLGSNNHRNGDEVDDDDDDDEVWHALL